MEKDEPTDQISFDLNVRVEMWGEGTKCHKIGIGNTWIQVDEVK